MATLYQPAGADLTAVDSTAKFTVGQKGCATDGSEWIYVEIASGVTAITQYMTCLVERATYTAAGSLGGAANDGNTKMPAFHQGSTTLTAGDFCWLMTQGAPRIMVAKAAAENAQLFTTQTTGVLDDAIATGSQYPLRGVVAASISAGVASNTAGGVGDGRATNPNIGPIVALY